MKRHFTVSLMLFLGLMLEACSGPIGSAPTPAPSATAFANTASAGDDLMQTKDEASVTVAITPLNLNDKSAAMLDFKVALNTHSVDLNYDYQAIATLSSDAGEKVQASKWDGPTSGGHHVGGTLSFPALKNRGQSLTLTLNGIANIPERTFTWKVN